MANFFDSIQKGTGITGLTNWLTGNSKPKMGSTLNKDQQQMFKQYQQGIENNPTYQGGNNFLQQLYSNQPGAFEAFERPYKTQFEQETVPLLSERFAGMGTGGGALNSSGFQQTLAQAGRGLSENLAAQRGNMQIQGLGQALNYAQQPFTNLLNGINVNTQERQPGQQGGLGGFAQGGGLAALMQLLTKYFTGGAV